MTFYNILLKKYKREKETRKNHPKPIWAMPELDRMGRDVRPLRLSLKYAYSGFWPELRLGLIY